MQDFIDLPLNIFDDVQELVDVDDSLLQFAQEIWMCFNITQHEMISDTKSGSVNLPQLLFNRSVNNVLLKSIVDEEIANNCSGVSDFTWETEIRFIRDDKGRDVVVIDVMIYDNNDRTFRQRFMFK